MNPIHRYTPLRGLMALAIVSWLVPGEAVPQEQKKESEKAAAATREMQVIAAKFVKARELGSVLQQALDGRTRVSFDERSNAVIVVATPEDMATVKELIEKIDVPKATTEAPVQFLPLRNTKADLALENALHRFLPSGSYFLDYERNLVILSGDEKTQQTAVRLIDRLDRPTERAKAPDQQVQIRVIWLASGLDKKDGRKPPEDMKPVVAELEKMGIEEPRLVTQTLVTALPGKEFRVEGLAGLDSPFQLFISGTLLGATNRGENDKLKISIHATGTMSRPGPVPSGGKSPAPVSISVVQLGRLETEITAPLGHSVVLGVTPTATSTSAFVVQMLPKR
jgi:hypothetical protein